jgi:hypothetical protein
MYAGSAPSFGDVTCPASVGKALAESARKLGDAREAAARASPKDRWARYEQKQYLSDGWVQLHVEPAAHPGRRARLAVTWGGPGYTSRAVPWEGPDRLGLDELRAYAATPRAALVEQCLEGCSLIFAPRAGTPVTIPLRPAFAASALSTKPEIAAALPLPDGRWLIHAWQPTSPYDSWSSSYWALGDVDLVLVLSPEGAVVAQRTFVWPIAHLGIGDRLLALRDGAVPGLLVEQAQPSAPLAFYGLDPRDQGAAVPLPTFDGGPCPGPAPGPRPGPGMIAVTSMSGPALDMAARGERDPARLGSARVQTLVEYRDGGRCFRRARVRPAYERVAQPGAVWPAHEVGIEVRGASATLALASEPVAPRPACAYRPPRRAGTR